MSTHRFILEPYKGVSTRHTCPNCHRKDVSPSTLIRRSESSFRITLGVATTSRNAVIISHPVITLNGIHLKRKSCPKITLRAMRLLRQPSR